MSEAIDALFVNSPAATRTETEKAFAQATISQIGDIDFLVDAIVGAVFFTLLLMVGNSLMQSFRERVREFAILKTIGFRAGTVASLVVCEALLLCGLIGAVNADDLVAASQRLFDDRRANGPRSAGERDLHAAASA